MASNNRLADDTEVQSIDFTKNGDKVPIDNLAEYIQVTVCRDKTPIPEWQEYDPENNQTHPDTGMSCHEFQADFENMAIGLEFSPADYDIPYEVFIRYEVFPTLDDYDFWIPFNIYEDNYYYGKLIT